ncbi:MAG: hypothetical protein M0042_15015 [Nitrospiraceae bacterium]|nr:hypothetical protein [Nitrospiraceae bacterium]
MELEYLFHSSGFALALQLLFLGSVMMPGAMGRADLYRKFLSATASLVVTIGPFSLLLYMLYEVSKLS